MKENLLNINTIRKYVKEEKIFWTNHCLNRLNKRKIAVVDVKTAISNGEIIEYYYEDYPYPSCLIIGFNIKNKQLHIVCGVSNKIVYMITAYYPDDNKWEEDMKIRRKE